MTSSYAATFTEGQAVLTSRIADRVLASAQRDGAEFAELYIESRRVITINLANGELENLHTVTESGAGVRVVTSEGTRYAYTTQLDEPGLVAAARCAASGYAQGTPSGPAVADPRPLADVGVATPLSMVRQADAGARSGSVNPRHVSCSYLGEEKSVSIANSAGVRVTESGPRTSLRVECIVADGDGAQRGVSWLGRSQGPEALDGDTPHRIGRQALDKAVAKIGARPVPTGTMPIVLAAGAGGVLFHEACGHGLEADLVESGASAFANRLGEQVASPLVTLIDDPRLPGAWGTYRIDDEGIPAQRTILIENGVLTSYLWDRRRARRAGTASTGNGRRQGFRDLPLVRMSNTFLANGTESPEDILAATPRGVYVTGLTGGQVDTTSGDFAFGLSDAFLIEDGKVTDPLRSANLIGNGVSALLSVAAVGNDLRMWDGGEMCGKGQRVPAGVGQPTVKVNGLVVGGTDA